MQVKILAEGGEMKPSPALSQKIGPLGINVNQVIQRVNDATKNFKGMKVPVELEINPSTKDFEVKIFSPPVSGLIKKELGIDKGSGEQKRFKQANASMGQVISVARTKFPNMLCKDLKSAVKTVVGTCVSLGVLIENKPAKEIENEIDEGRYNKEIEGEMTETSDEKKKELEEYFSKVKLEQDRVKKQEQALKEAKEEKDAKKAVVGK